MENNNRIKQAFSLATGLTKYADFNIEQIIDIAPDGFENNTIYGFNVRLQKEDALTPIMGGKKTRYSVVDIAKRIDPNRTILKVFEQYPDKEIAFSVKKENGFLSVSPENCSIDQEVINTMTTPSFDEQGRGSFLNIQMQEMFPDDSKVYYWICRENEELKWIENGHVKSNNPSSPVSYLSNVLVISSNKDNIKFAKEHRIDFIRFLFKLQTAYSMVLAKELEMSSVRAAIAQVMARNMSHNFGSHVLSNLVGDGVYEKLDDEAVKKLKSFNPKETDEVYKDLYKALEEPEKPAENNKSKNHQLQYFFQYLKTRMDYLSEVTFGVPNLLTTKLMYGEVMKELDQVRILLNYISGVSNFNYNFKLMLGDKEITAENAAVNDFSVAFPSDVLGCHAFYNIIENIIRNTAKHAKNNSKPVTFTITFKDVDSKDCEDIEEAAELYCVEIVNGVREDNIEILVNGEKNEKDEIVKKGQNTRLNESVLDKNNNLRSHSLGLLEMEASAAFLRQIDMPEIESEDYHVGDDDKYFHERNGKKRLNILKAFAIDVEEMDGKNEKGETIKVKTGRMGYRFFVQKPKEFLFVGNWDGVCDKKRLLNYGIQFIKSEDFMKELINGKSFPHQFLIYDDTLCEILCEKVENVDKELKPYDSLLPLRRIHDDGGNAETKKTDYFAPNGKALIQKLKEFAWKRYFDNVVKKELNANRKSTEIVLSSDFRELDKSQVDFLDHASKDKVIEYGSTRSRRVFRDNNEVFVENLTSRTQEKLPRFSELSKLREGDSAESKPSVRYVNHIESDNIEYLKQEIFEAYHNKVIILDERVQKFAEENDEGSAEKGELIPCWRLFGSTNVFLPRRPRKDDKGNLITLKDWDEGDLNQEQNVFSLDPNDFKEDKEKVENYVTNHVDNAFVLVHYGVLERMYNGEENLINDTLEAWAAKAKRVVVTSGRGAHSLNLPNSVCFANLSSVLYACVENRNKYIINYLLNQSRRKNG